MVLGTVTTGILIGMIICSIKVDIGNVDNAIHPEATSRRFRAGFVGPISWRVMVYRGNVVIERCY